MFFSSTKSENKRLCPEAGCGEEVAQIMYTHVSKYKNDRIKERKKRDFVMTY
jgi:hypothetical protein